MSSGVRLRGYLTRLRLLAVVAWAVFSGIGPAQTAPAPAELLPRPLSADEAVRWAMQNNLEMAVVRQQNGIAAAEAVTAGLYPFNPLLDTKVRQVLPPRSSDISNVISQEHKVTLEVEIHGQRGHRLDAARAALSRTQWEVAHQEQALSLRVLRSFHSLVYRHEKLQLAEETLRLMEEALRQQRQMAEQRRLKPGDVIQTRAELEDVRAQLGTGRLALTAARQELLHALGAADQPLTVKGGLETGPLFTDTPHAAQEALRRRADLQARRLAVEEAEARLRLTRANRHGNPVIGPDVEYDDGRTVHVGVQLVIPLPVLNRRQGEIQQRQAELSRAVFALRQAEREAEQEVQSALARQMEASSLLASCRNQVLPGLRAIVEDAEKLLAQGDAGVDVPRLLDLRRRLLRGREGYLDALWELHQARTDLAAALGDPCLALAAGSSP